MPFSGDEKQQITELIQTAVESGIESGIRKIHEECRYQVDPEVVNSVLHALLEISPKSTIEDGLQICRDNHKLIASVRRFGARVGGKAAVAIFMGIVMVIVGWTGLGLFEWLRGAMLRTGG